MKNNNYIEFLTELSKSYDIQGNELMEKARNTKNDFEKDNYEIKAIECYGIANGLRKAKRIYKFW